MLVADDLRRYVDANSAACLLLRAPRESVLRLRIDDLTPPEFRGAMVGLWEAFLREGSQSGKVDLLMPDGVRLRLDYSATASVQPGRHLSVLALPTREEGDEPSWAPEPLPSRLLTEREREVMALVAMGERSVAIAEALGISPATVETHVRHGMTKLGAKSRAHAVTLGLQQGEIGLHLPALSQ